MKISLQLSAVSYQLILPIISAILLVLTYPTFNLEFLAWFALVPLFLALENRNFKRRFIIGHVFGIIFFSGILYWLVNVTVPGTIVLILLLSIAPAIFCMLCPSSIVHRPSSIVFIPSAWVLTEYLRTHLFIGFPWALLGYSQSFNLPMIQIADITGVYGVSFFIVFVNLGLYLVLRKSHGRFYPVRNFITNGGYLIFPIFILFILVLAYGQNRISRIYPPAQKLKISVIQGNILQNLKWDPQYREFIIDKYKTLTKESLKEKPDLVIWPETSVPGYLEEESDLKSQILNLAKSGNTHLLVGTLRERGAKIFNSATLISNNGEVLESYDKIHLVPFGEFIPLGRSFFWIRALIDKPIGDFTRGREFTVFKFKLQKAILESGRIQKTTEFHKFSSLICFEDIFPNLCRNFVRKGARFLVNITNDAWFGRTSSPYQHMQNSIFRAVENRVPVIRAANTGFSCIIDHKGKVIKSVRAGKDEIFVDGYAVGTIMPAFSSTIYTRFGDVFSWICIAVVAISLGVRLKSKISCLKR